MTTFEELQAIRERAKARAAGEMAAEGKRPPSPLEEEVKNFGKEVKGAAERAVGRAQTAIRGVVEGVPVLGPLYTTGARKAAAKVSAALEGGDAEVNEARLRAGAEARKDEFPVTNAIAQGAGLLGSAMALPATKTLGGAIGRAVGVGETDLLTRKGVQGELPTGTEIGATAVGGTAGSIFGWYLGPMMGSLLQKLGKGHPATKAALPIVKKIEDSSTKASNELKLSGVKFHPKAMEKHLAHLDHRVRGMGIDEKLTPVSYSNYVFLRNQIEKGEAADITTYRRLYDKFLMGAGGNVSKDDKAINSFILKEMDRFIETLPKRAAGRGVLEGNAEKAAKAWGEYTKATELAPKTQAIAEVFQNADDVSTAGFESYDKALQKGFLNLLRDKDKIGRFTEQEVGEIRKLARGQLTTRVFNRIDSVMYNTPFVGMIYKAKTAIPRMTAGEMAERQALEVFGNISQMPIPMPMLPSGDVGMLGGLIGGQMGQAAGAPNPVKLPERQMPSGSGSGAWNPTPIPQNLPNSGTPQFPKVPGAPEPQKRT